MKDDTELCQRSENDLWRTCASCVGSSTAAKGDLSSAACSMRMLSMVNPGAAQLNMHTTTQSCAKHTNSIVLMASDTSSSPLVLLLNARVRLAAVVHRAAFLPPFPGSSLLIHVPQCAAKWCQQHNAAAPPAAPPELPSSAEQVCVQIRPISEQLLLQS